MIGLRDAYVRIYICPGCYAHLGEDDLIRPIPNLQERILPGEAMPAGECPDCNELVPLPGGDE
jgi:hypothetical protein